MSLFLPLRFPMSASLLRHVHLSVLLVAGTALPSVLAAQLGNGNFENNPLPNFPIVSAGVFVDPGTNTWKVSFGSINVGTTPAGTACATAGGHCVDLNGNVRGGIEQKLQNLPAGRTCTVGFQMSRHKNFGASAATLRAFVNGVATSPATFTHSVPGVTGANGQWQPKTFTFVSPTLNPTRSFESAMEGPAGPQMDNMTMTCVSTGTEPGGGVVNEAVIGVNPAVLVSQADPCCPPWNATTLGDRMIYQSAGGIAGSYTLKFQSNATLNAQMTAYITYLHAMDAALTSIKIDFQMFFAGTGASPVVAGTPSPTSTVTWTTSGGPSPAPNFFANGAMQKNAWYTIRTRVYLNDGNSFFPDTCSNVELSVRIQVLGLAAGGGERTVLQFRSATGRIVERELKK